MIRMAVAMTAICYMALATKAKAEQITVEKIDAINELLQASGLAQSPEQLARKAAKANGQEVRRRFAGKPEQVYVRAEQIVYEAYMSKADAIKQANQKVVMAYASGLTADEINQLNSFYHSKLGRKSVFMGSETLRFRMEQSESLSQQLGQDIAARLKSELGEELGLSN